MNADPHEHVRTMLRHLEEMVAAIETRLGMTQEAAQASLDSIQPVANTPETQIPSPPDTAGQEVTKP